MYLYRDDEIKIPENIPVNLLNALKELDESYDNGTKDEESEEDIMLFLEYSRNLEIVEVTTKDLCGYGAITEQQLDTIFKRYGLRV